MNRRDFTGLTLAAVGGIFVPKYGVWYREQPLRLWRDGIHDDQPALQALIDGGTLLDDGRVTRVPRTRPLYLRHERFWMARGVLVPSIPHRPNALLTIERCFFQTSKTLPDALFTWFRA